MIAILGAMTEEIEPILAHLNGVKTQRIGGNDYHIGVYAGREVLVAYSKIGKVNAAQSASVMISGFGAKRLLFSGVAGALNPALKIGDLIYATRLVQHDVDISAFGHKLGFIPETGDFFATDSALNETAKIVAAELGVPLGSGVLATGDQFIASEEKKLWIRQTFAADAVEMEGAAVASVCAAFGIPFFVLRAISDAADMDAGFSFDEFLRASAQISADFVLKMAAKL